MHHFGKQASLPLLARSRPLLAAVISFGPLVTAN